MSGFVPGQVRVEVQVLECTYLPHIVMESSLRKRTEGYGTVHALICIRNNSLGQFPPIIWVSDIR